MLLTLRATQSVCVAGVVCKVQWFQIIDLPLGRRNGQNTTFLMSDACGWSSGTARRNMGRWAYNHGTARNNSLYSYSVVVVVRPSGMQYRDWRRRRLVLDRMNNSGSSSVRVLVRYFSHSAKRREFVVPWRVFFCAKMMNTHSVSNTRWWTDWLNRERETAGWYEIREVGSK